MEQIKIGSVKGKKIINPELHSHFIEFLGNCIKEGIWVGEESSIPNYDGMRKDVVDALKRIEPPLIRWPGGCYADTYHWRDGIGSREKRKTTFNENFGTYEIENNQFGTHEFMQLCKIVGAKPWLNINMLSGTVQEAVEWTEYCNRKEETTLSLERSNNGSVEPFNVEYWGIGNECWAGGGNYTAQGYANEYRKFTSAIPSFKPINFNSNINSEGINMNMIACGPDGNKPKERVRWTKDFFDALREYRMPKLSAFDLHFYNWNFKNTTETELDFDKDDWYRVIHGCMELEGVIKEQNDLIQEGLSNLPIPEGDFPYEQPKCDLIVGEWGNWHAQAFTARPALYQQCSMRDALTTAITLDIFHRNCDIVKIACVAQSVNVLNSLILTEGEKMVLTPNYYVFEMYKVHRNAQVLDISIESSVAYNNDEIEIYNIYSFASVKDGVISINIINASIDEEREVDIVFEDELEFLSGKILNGSSSNSYNSISNPDEVKIEKAKEPELIENKVWRIKIPKASVSVYQFYIIK